MPGGRTSYAETRASEKALRPTSGEFELVESKEANANVVE